MALNFENIIIDINTYLDTNWDAVTYPIDWNGVKFSPTDHNSFIQPFIDLTATEQTEITGDDSGVEVFGFLRVNIFNKVGNATTAATIASLLSDLFNKQTISTTAIINFQIANFENGVESEDLPEYFESSFFVQFRARTN